jgi:dTDP-4-dehydrorhamnose reductase
MSRLLNHEFPAQLATETNRLGVKLIHFSTPSVFSGDSSPNTEADTPDSASVYGATKAFGDFAVLENDPNAIILRLNFTSFRRSPETFAYKVFDSANHARSFDAFSDVFFNPVDSEIVGDLSLRLFQDDMSGLFNLGSTMTISKYAFAREVYVQLGRNPSLVRNIAGSPISQNKFFSSNTSLDTKRLSSYLGEKSGEFLTLDFAKLKTRYFDYLTRIKLSNP